MKTLILCCVNGKNSLHRLYEMSNNYDIGIVNYGEKIDNIYKYYKESKGYKFNLIHDLVLENIDIFNYDYIWIPDSDIAISEHDILTMLKIADKYRLNISQPSLDPKTSYLSWKIAAQDKQCEIRYSSAVEMMCPLFNQESFKKCFHTFNFNRSGWGLDLYWPTLVNHKDIAIIDDICVIHTKPVTSQLIKFKDGTGPYDELNEMRKKYELVQPEIIKKILKD